MGGLISGFVFGMATTGSSGACQNHATGHQIVISGIPAVILCAGLVLAVGWVAYQDIRDHLMEKKAQRRSGNGLF